MENTDKNPKNEISGPDPKIYTQDIFGHRFPAPCWTGTFKQPCTTDIYSKCSKENITCRDYKRFENKRKL